MRHKAAITILFFLLLQAGHAFSQSSEVALFSYSELMRLSPEQRTQYIADVQAMLVELSKIPNGRISDSDPKARTRLKAWLEMMALEINSAKAQEVAPAASRPLGSSNTIRSAAASRKEKNYPTIEEYIASRVQFDILKCKSKYQSPNLRTATVLPDCSPDVEAQIQLAFSQQQKVHDVGVTTDPAMTAVALKTWDEKATDENWAKILAEREVAAAAASQSQVATSPVPGAVVVTRSLSKGAATGKQVGRKIPYSEIEAILKEKKNPHSLCDDDAKQAGTGPMALVKTDADTSYCMTDQAAALFREGKLDLATGAERAAPSKAISTSAASTKPAQTPSVASQYPCAPKPKECPDPNSMKAQVYAGNQKCVFAGMFSQLDSQNKRCAPVTDFSIPGLTLKCGREQTMCNPLLFGATSEKSAICVGRAQNATAQCSKLSSPRDAEKFINRNLSGLQEKWDELQKQLGEICKPDTASAKFHCAECNIMEARLFEINARVLGKNTCGSRSQGMDAMGSRIQHNSAPTQSKGVKK